jgi:transcriptional regulator with XRE-family HTH domain
MAARGRAMEILAARVRGLPRGTQARVAELAGLRAETITRWKGGRGNPRLTDLEAFAASLDVSVAWLITDDGPEQTPTLPPTPAAERKLERLVRDGEKVQAALPAALDAVRGRKR